MSEHVTGLAVGKGKGMFKAPDGEQMAETHRNSEGDWIVHSHYGIGQIKAVEMKCISGEEARYYRIETTDSTFWMPVDQMDSELLRPLSTPEEMQRAVNALHKPPKEMSSNFKIRQSRIQQARLRNTPKAIAQLIRDLRARRREKGVLNSTERSAFQTLKQRLAEEWALVIDADTEHVESRIDDLLNPEEV
jgi:RNA polymerase-interacting CarD/CdnL/TRCF family regulator